VSTTLDPEAIRQVLQQQSVTLTVRVVALLVAAALFLAVSETVRRRKLREDFTPIWVTCAIAILLLALSFDALVWFTNLIGAWTPSSAVFFFGLVFLVAISLSYAVRLSALTDQVKTLAQEIAIANAEHPPARTRNE
jgi:drug/metabolite transporter (DMT)-like permease